MKKIIDNEKHVYINPRLNEYNDYLMRHSIGVEISWHRVLLPYIKDNKISLFTDEIISTITQNISCHDRSKMIFDECIPYCNHFYPSEGFEDNVDEFNHAWMLHYSRNPHHWQHWIVFNNKNDNSVYDKRLEIKASDMPIEFIAEMLCDWHSFSLNNPEDTAYNYWKKMQDLMILSDETISYIKMLILAFKKPLEKPTDMTELELKFNSKNDNWSWALREIEIATKKKEENEFDTSPIIKLRYQQALDAYTCISYSNQYVDNNAKTIFNRLCSRKPISAIFENEDSWEKLTTEFIGKKPDVAEEYICTRLPSLFKTIKKDGSVEYNDVDRIICVNNSNPFDRYYNGFCAKIVNEIMPIKFPYYPNDKPMEIYCEEFLVDPNAGDFDTIGIIELKIVGTSFNADSIKRIGRYFKADLDDWKEIDREEYELRRSQQVIKVHHHIKDNEEEIDSPYPFLLRYIKT